MSNLRLLFAGLGLVCFLMGLSPAARADNTPKNMTDGEKALLPVWCLDSQSFGYGDAYFDEPAFES